MLWTIVGGLVAGIVLSFAVIGVIAVTTFLFDEMKREGIANLDTRVKLLEAAQADRDAKEEQEWREQLEERAERSSLTPSEKPQE